MELYQIRYALAVGRLQSFTRAAEEIPVSVTSVSEAVKDLEAELGVALFQRTTRRVWPTPAGELFLERAARLLADAEALRREIATFRGVHSASVSLGTPPVAVVQNLPAFLAGFNRDFPSIEVRLVEANSRQLLQSLRSREVDISFLSGPPGWLPEDIEARELGRHETGIVLAPGHPLASLDCVELSSLAEMPMVMNSPGYPMREIALEVCRRAGIRPRIAQEAIGAEMLFGLVRAGAGFAILARPRAEAVGLAFVRCVPRPLDRILMLGWFRGRSISAAAGTLRDEICRQDGWVAV